MEQRPKLELKLNESTSIKLLYDDPIVGNSQYGEYYLYAIRNGDGNEYSFFAPKSVHDVLKDLKSGDEAVVTKLAAERGNKVVTTYHVESTKNNNLPEQEDVTDESEFNPYLDTMQQSLNDALSLKKKFEEVNVNQLAVTIFISRMNNGRNKYPSSN